MFPITPKTILIVTYAICGGLVGAAFGFNKKLDRDIAKLTADIRANQKMVKDQMNHMLGYNK